MDSTTFVISVGELVVDTADVRKQDFHLGRSCQRTVSQNLEKEKTVDKALAKMFKKFPPMPGQK